MNTECEIKNKLENLMEWLRSNPKLPAEINPTLLKRFLKCSNMNLEETKKLIEHNYYLRNKNANIFINRDPKNEITEKCFFTYQIVPIPGLTPDKNKIICFRLVNEDVRCMNSLEESKCYFLLCDTRFAYSDAKDIKVEEADIDNSMESLASGEIHILDIGRFTLRYVASMSIALTRIYLNFMQEAYPVRLKAMHLINCPKYFDRMVAIFKPFVRDDVFKMMHFHTGGIESLYEHVPRDMLPEDLGGKAPSLSKLSEDWWKLILKRRDYLMDPKHWQIFPTTKQSNWSWW